MEESLEGELEKLKRHVHPWDIQTYLERDVTEAFKENEQVDIIYGTLVTRGLDESELRRYLKKVDDICKTIVEEIPNIREFSHYERGKAIFNKIWERYIKGTDRYQYKLTELLDTGIGNCHSLSAFIGGVMQRFGLHVVFKEYVGPDTHFNIGLVCEDEEEKPIITVESSIPTGYNFADFDEYILSNYNLKFNSNRDLNAFCGDGMNWRGWDEYKKNRPVDPSHLLKLDLIGHEFAPDDSAILYNIAHDMYSIMLDSEINASTESNVDLIVELLEHVLMMRPEFENATNLLLKVKFIER